MSSSVSSYEDSCDALGVTLVANVPVILWGAPGVGKTSVIEQIASHHGWWTETVIASISDPTDFKGMPREDAGRTVFSPPSWATSIVDAGGGLVFLDEITTAPPSVQAALLRPVLGRVVGDLPLPEQTRFVAAANPPEIAADGWDLSAPLANRFVHLDWTTPANVISDGLIYGFSDIAIPDVDPEVLPQRRESTRLRVGAFLRARPDLLTRVPDATADQGVAWPSPRTWEMAARLLAYGRAAGVSDGAVRLLLTGVVGAPAAREYLAWENALDLPDIEKALAKQGKIDLPERPDHIVAVCGALVAAVLADPTTQRCEAAVNGVLLGVCRAGHVDLATVALRRIKPQLLSSRATVTPEAFGYFADILDKMGKLQPAGRR